MAQQTNGQLGRSCIGTVEGPCPQCRQTIPANTLTCPYCSQQRRFNQDQYNRLIQCARNGNIAEWNRWREQNPDEPIELEAANLARANLARANLASANLASAYLASAYLKGANFRRARLQCAWLRGADLAEIMHHMVSCGN